MDKKHLNFLSKTFLFMNIPPPSLEKMLDKIELEFRAYEKNECIYSANAFEEKLGFVYEGECLVERIRAPGNTVPLNTLKKYGSFGITGVLSIGNEIPTSVSAKKKSTILFIPANEILKLISTNPSVAFNVINFLADRIAFLNKKVEVFTSTSNDSKLASYLLSKYKSDGLSAINVSLSGLAEVLGCGRASIYRSINTLTALGAIAYENKKIYIKDAERLERNT